MILQSSNPAGHMRNHQYHERFDTHGMVLDRRADIEYCNTMIYTIEKLNNCLPMPASARSGLLPLDGKRAIFSI